MNCSRNSDDGPTTGAPEITNSFSSTGVLDEVHVKRTTGADDMPIVRWSRMGRCQVPKTCKSILDYQERTNDEKTTTMRNNNVEPRDYVSSFQELLDKVEGDSSSEATSSNSTERKIDANVSCFACTSYGILCSMCCRIRFCSKHAFMNSEYKQVCPSCTISLMTDRKTSDRTI